MKVYVLKDGRRVILWEEEWCDTYKPWNILVTEDESILPILGGDLKQLVLVCVCSVLHSQSYYGILNPIMRVLCDNVHV